MPVFSKHPKSVVAASVCILALASVVFCQKHSDLIPPVKQFLDTALSAPPAVQHSLTKAEYADGNIRAADAAERVTPRLTTELTQKNLTLGAPVFLRIFKQSKELELWIESEPNGAFKLFKTYRIAAMSGKLGPKLAEGDKQAPEGFYYVSKGLMNPRSRFHLAFNIGYPNAYDKAHGRDGSFIMVHGNQVSIGCFAMTDYYIEEIYTLCDAALANGQPFFRVHSFPFRLTAENLAAQKNHQWHTFWNDELKEGYDFFEKTKQPPSVEVVGKKYVFEES